LNALILITELSMQVQVGLLSLCPHTMPPDISGTSI